MHRRVIVAGLWVAAAIAPAMAVAQAAASGGSAAGQASAAAVSPAESFNSLLSIMESQIVPAAEAMPADKFDFAPPTSFGLYAGVRTFAQQVKHLTEANYSIFRAYGVPGAVDAKTIEALTTKDQIVDALKKSYAYAHAAVSTITVENAFEPVGPPQRHLTRATLAAYGIAHSMDHYGQMVEYLRMNGIVPPASRR
ncbi:MAG TPA: DinB family protein [Acidobacteriaceae bacterium]|nr:DinB family protein [Acidobacteriaceae bacterium]